MKTKQELALLLMKNASEEARELLEHHEKVAALILRDFPDQIPDRFMDAQIKSTDSALLGGFRAPEETCRLMLEHCLFIIDKEKALDITTKT
jgi:hypothetical protein